MGGKMNSKSLWKKVILAILLVSVLNISAFSQEASQNSQNASETTETAWEQSESYFANPVSTDETDSSTSTRTSTASTVWIFVKMILVLAIFIAAIYGVLWYIKKRNNTVKNDDEFLRRVSYLTLAPGKTVEIVTLIDKAYILGVSDAGINLIAEVTDKELIDAMNVYSDKQTNTKKSRSFAEVLNLFMPNAAQNEEPAAENTGLADLIKKAQKGLEE